MSLLPKIVYQDDDLLVIEKPAGIIVNRSETVKEETIQDWVETKIKMVDEKIEKKSDFLKRSGIVHRLDKETSGLLIIAKNENTFIELQRQFKERKVEKRYLALVHGEVKPKEGKIEASLTRNPFDRKKFGVFLGGKEAVTEYRVLRYYETNIQKEKRYFTLVEVFPKTGRTHQIRVHFKYIGYPVVGDEVYAGRKTARFDRKWCPRLFLHAYYLKFVQPETKKEIALEINLPDDLKTILNRLTEYS